MDKQAFTMGFIKELATHGYTMRRFEDEMPKVAFVGEVLKTVLPMVPAALTAGAILIPAGLALSAGTAHAAGRMAGRGAHMLTEPSPADLEVIKKEEEIDTYKRLTADAKRRAAERRAVGM